MITSNRFVRLLPCVIAIALSAGCGASVPCPEGTTASGTQCVTVWGHVEGTLTLELQSDHGGVFLMLLGSTQVAVTGSDGKFSMGAVKAGDYTLEARRAGFETARFPVTIVDGKATTVTDSLKLGGSGGDGATIRGTATQLGVEDQSGTTVTVDEMLPAGTTGTDGSFVLPSVPLGVHTLRFNYGPYSTTIPSVLAVQGTDGLVIAGSVFPFAPLDLPRAQKLSGDSGDDLYAVAASGRTAVTTFSDPLTRETLFRVTSFSGSSAVLERGAAYVEASLTGQFVTYRSSQTAQSTWTLKSYAAESGAVATLSSDVVAYLGLTPGDGRAVYVVASDADQYDLMSIPPTGGTPTKLLTLSKKDLSELSTESSSRSYCLTSDGKRLVVPSNAALHLVSTDNATPAVEITPLTGPVYYTSCVPSSDRATYMADSGITYVVSLAANQTPVSLGSSSNNLRGFTPDGHYAYSPSGSTSTGYWLVDLVAGTRTSLPVKNYSNGLLPVFTNGNTTVVWGDGESLQKRVLSTGEVTTLGSQPPVRQTLFSSPDGNTVYLWLGTNLSQLSAVKVATGETQTILEVAPSGRPSLQSISPDGTKLLFNGQAPRGAAALVLPATGGTLKPLMYVHNGGAGPWIDSSTVLAFRRFTPTPFGTQDGLYKLAVP